MEAGHGTFYSVFCQVVAPCNISHLAAHTAGSLPAEVTVPANSSVTFSVWGQAWSTGKSWDGELSDVNYSAEPTPVNMKIGIDPTGGTDPSAPTLSGQAQPTRLTPMSSLSSMPRRKATE